MQARLFYGSVCGFTFGVGVETVWNFSSAVVVWVMFLALVGGVLWRRRSFAPAAPMLLLVSVTLFAVSLGMLRFQLASEKFGHSSLASVVDTAVTLHGTVIQEPTKSAQATQLYVDTGTDVILVSTDRTVSVTYGDQVVVSGTLRTPESFTTDLGRTFDYPGYLLARGVEYRLSFADVVTAGSGGGNFIISSLLAVKHTFITSLERIIPEPAVGLGEGLLLGVNAALGDAIESDFRRTGIIHIVVLSGYNIMLVVAFIIFCLSYLLPRTIRLFFAVLSIIAFALIVGLSATVVRASIMAGLVLLAQWLGRSYHVVRALVFAGVVMLLINPYLLVYDIGFQLSFMATLGLVLLLPHFETLVVKGTMLGAKEFLLSTVATQVAVLPLLMYHIGEVSLIAVVVNLLVLPVVPFAMFLTFLAGLGGLVVPFLGMVFGYVATFVLRYILEIAHYFAAVPFATISIPAFSAPMMLLLYAGMFLVWYRLERRNTSSYHTPKVTGWIVEEEQNHHITTPVFFRKD